MGVVLSEIFDLAPSSYLVLPVRHGGEDKTVFPGGRKPGDRTQTSNQSTTFTFRWYMMFVAALIAGMCITKALFVS